MLLAMSFGANTVTWSFPCCRIQWVPSSNCAFSVLFATHILTSQLVVVTDKTCKVGCFPARYRLYGIAVPVGVRTGNAVQ